MSDEIRHIWEQQPGEPTLWYGRFRAYLAQSPPRSGVAVYREERARRGAEGSGKKRLALIETIPCSWQQAKECFQWKARADAFDKYQIQERERALVQARSHEDETALAVAVSLRRVGLNLLDLPTTSENVRAFQVACGLFSEALEHARTVLGMPKKHALEVTGKDSQPRETRAVEQPPVERLEALVALMRDATAAGDVVETSREVGGSCLVPGSGQVGASGENGVLAES